MSIPPNTCSCVCLQCSQFSWPFCGRQTCYLHQSIWHWCGFELLVIGSWFNCFAYSLHCFNCIASSFALFIHCFVYIAYHFASILALLCMLLTILYLLSLFSFQARYCMYGSFEAGATRRAAQVLYPPSETYWELHNSLTSFLHCSVVWCMLA